MKVTIEPRSREVRDARDVEALLEEIRAQLLAELEKGKTVRLRLG